MLFKVINPNILVIFFFISHLSNFAFCVNNQISVKTYDIYLLRIGLFMKHNEFQLYPLCCKRQHLMFFCVWLSSIPLCVYIIFSLFQWFYNKRLFLFHVRCNSWVLVLGELTRGFRVSITYDTGLTHLQFTVVESHNCCLPTSTLYWHKLFTMKFPCLELVT